MRIRANYILIIISAVLMGQAPATAQGTGFTYQGKLNLNGASAVGVYDFRFRVASDAAGNAFVGSPLLTNGVRLDNGAFTVLLDFGAGVFAAGNRWLQVEVKTNAGANYTVLAPLQKFTPAPYALSAANVTGPVPAAQVSGTLGVAQLPAATVTNNAIGVRLSGSFYGNGSGLTNLNAPSLTGVVPAGSIADGSIASGKLATDAGSLAKVTGGVMSSSGSSVTLFGNEYLNDRDLLFRNDSFHGLGWYGSGKLFAGNNVNGPALFGGSGGVLGTVGATTNIALEWDSGAKVTIAGHLHLRTNAYANDREIYLRDDANHGLGWYGAGKPFAGLTLDGPVLYGWSGGALGFHHSGGTNIALYWNNAGQVGIGTTSPTENLEVNGAVRIRGKLRMGDYTGTHEDPFPDGGLILRRINSSTTDTGHIVARCGPLWRLERDGTPGGFYFRQSVVVMSTNTTTLAFTGVTTNATTVTYTSTFKQSGSQGPYRIFSDSQGVVKIHGTIGMPDHPSGGDWVEVSLMRTPGGSRWIGTLITTHNQ